MRGPHRRRPEHPAPPDDFLSGESGGVWGIRATTRAILMDGIDDAAAAMTLRSLRLSREARRHPVRRILVLSVRHEEGPNLLETARQELMRSRHQVSFGSRGAGGLGKFENLNLLLGQHELSRFDWLIVLDDDVALPGGFLDRFVFLAERFSLDLAAPSHRHRSHAAWQVTRRRRGSVVRETRVVEIGPVTGFHRSTFQELLPFPPLRFGWGLDAHWGAVAEQRGWRVGVLDAVPVRHGLRRIATAYSREDAIAEGRAFLAERPYISNRLIQETLAAHRSWR